MLTRRHENIMLKCRDIAHRSSDYLDDNLALGQRIGVTMHLFMCGKCSAFIRHLRTALDYYARLPEVPLGDEETAVVVEHIFARHAERSE